MYKPYIKPVFTASPDVELPEPHISKLVVLACQLLGRIYLFIFLGITRVVLRNGKPFFEAFRRALEGKSRCIMAFRHPNGGEPQLLMWFILFKFRDLAKKAGIKLCRRPHAFFVYGSEVVRWGGGVARWIMPGLGAMPVHHTKIDSVGMARIFKTMSDGPYPLAIAPEGKVSYTTESVPRLEQGTVRIGFWAADQLEKKGIPVEILPVSIHFRYGRMGWWSLKRLIRKIEAYTGFDSRDGAGFTERLSRTRNFILEQNEKRYGLDSGEQDYVRRIDTIMEAALDRAEKILGIRPRETGLVERLYHIREICWDRMIIPGSASLDHLKLLERAVKDLNAGESWYASRHIELVDFIWYFRVSVPTEDAPLYVKLEYVQNLWDFANRTMGGAYSNRVLNVHPKRVVIQVAPVINLSGRLEEYRENKKEAVARAMGDMEKAFCDCISRAAEYQI